MDEYPCPQYEPLPLTQEMIAAMLRSIASGKKEITYGTKKIVYHNVEDQLKILQWMQRNINGCSMMLRTTLEYNNGLNGPSGYYEGEEHDTRY